MQENTHDHVIIGSHASISRHFSSQYLRSHARVAAAVQGRILRACMRARTAVLLRDKAKRHVVTALSGRKHDTVSHRKPLRLVLQKRCLHRLRRRLQKRPLFQAPPYVCPEPVLANE
jgi:hypothetical protein